MTERLTIGGQLAHDAATAIQSMRIGTWNLEGRWSSNHRAFIEHEDCTHWLLTEVPNALSLANGTLIRSNPMSATKSWAAVWSVRPTSRLEWTTPTATAAMGDDGVFCSCILPWRGARLSWPTKGSLAEITLAAIDDLEASLRIGQRPIVWGGDWNHALRGSERAGSLRGRQALQSALRRLSLQVPTEHLEHAKLGLYTIDHVAIPDTWHVLNSRRVVAVVGDKRLSDHDAYIIECSPR